MMGKSFSFDPYAEFGPITAQADDYSDSEKLRMLADWFDRKDKKHGVGDDLVQRDLRRIADRLEET